MDSVLNQLISLRKNPSDKRVFQKSQKHQNQNGDDKTWGDEGKLFITQDKAYFQSQTYINLEKTDVKTILYGMTYEILDGVANYIRNGWYFKELLSLEIHTIQYKPQFCQVERIVFYPTSRCFDAKECND